MNLSHLIDLAHTWEATNVADRPRGISIYSRTEKSGIEASMYEPVMCLVLQGSKTTSVGDQLVELQPGDALLVSHDLPVISRITRASTQEPYTAIILSLDIGLVRSLYEQVADTSLSDPSARPLASGPAEQAWIAPLTRYLELINNPLDNKVLGPDILREIHYRLLLSSIGSMLRNLLVADSRANCIAKAIHRLRAEFRTVLTVADLANTAGMSQSSFHEHFKQVTGTTPRQYQKDLRLIEAHTLLTRQRLSVSQTALDVGYDSPTHFSRDYRKRFGVPPSKHVGTDVSTSAP